MLNFPLGDAVSRSNVVTMQDTFNGAVAFNRNLHWDVRNTRTFASMFRDASSFNQSLCWQLPVVANTHMMFEGTAGSIDADCAPTYGPTPAPSAPTPAPTPGPAGNRCKAMTAAQWMRLGCVFSNPTSTTVEDLGTYNRVTPTVSCEVSCPVDGGDFFFYSRSGG